MLSENEIQVFQKELDFAPIQKSINKPDLRKSSDKTAFRRKSNWKPLPVHSGLEVFLSQLEKEILNDFLSAPSNMSKEEPQALKESGHDKNIIIKLGDKGSCVVVFCRDVYIKEANKQSKDKTLYKILSNIVFKSLYTCQFITKKELKYFSYDFNHSHEKQIV